MGADILSQIAAVDKETVTVRRHQSYRNPSRSRAALRAGVLPVCLAVAAVALTLVLAFLVAPAAAAPLTTTTTLVLAPGAAAQVGDLQSQAATVQADIEALENLPGVLGLKSKAGRVEIVIDRSEDSIDMIVKLFQGAKILDINIKEPDLEDVFIELAR